MPSYFNHRVHTIPAVEAGVWQRREFLSAWWSIYADDRRWTPPHYGRLAREIQPRYNPHLARLRPLLVWVDALQRSGLGVPRQDQPIPLSSVLERPVAAAIALVDPRRSDNTAYLGLFQSINDTEAVERLLDALGDTLRHTGIRRLLGPTGLSPHLGSGLQSDSWDLWTPTGAPSNPPYVPDLLHDFMRPAQTGTLYQVTIPSDTVPTPGLATVRPLDPHRLTADLLPLFAAVLGDATIGCPPPDEVEAAYLLRSLGEAGRTGWLAEQDGRPVGFVLLGADTAGALRRARGGKRLYHRALLAGSSSMARPSAGRLFFGGVAPEARHLGIGRQLWAAALRTAREQRWNTLTVGPVWSEPAAAFLAVQGAVPVQSAEILAYAL